MERSRDHQRQPEMRDFGVGLDQSIFTDPHEYRQYLGKITDIHRGFLDNQANEYTQNIQSLLSRETSIGSVAPEEIKEATANIYNFTSVAMADTYARTDLFFEGKLPF
jgi:hypothetical protein